MFDSKSDELNVLAAADPTLLGPYEYGEHILFLVWMGLYEKALDQLAQAMDAQLFTTAGLRAYQFAVTMLYREAPVADFSVVCGRYGLLPNPVERMMHCPLLRPGVQVDARLCKHYPIFADDRTAELVTLFDNQNNYATRENLELLREGIKLLEGSRETADDAQLCSIYLGYSRRRAADVEAACWHALDQRPNNCQVQQALLMVLAQLGREEEAAMEATRFANLHAGRTRAAWIASRYRSAAGVEPVELDPSESKPRGHVKTILHVTQITNRLTRALKGGAIRLYKDSPEGKRLRAEQLADDFNQALKIDKVDFEGQPSPNQVRERVSTADAREFGRLMLYLTWAGHYELLAELCLAASAEFINQSSTIAAIRIAACAACSPATGNWREPKLTLSKGPGIIGVTANPPVRVMNPLELRKWMPDQRHSYFKNDSSADEFVLVNLGSAQLELNTLVSVTLRCLRANSADVDALAIAAQTLIHLGNFDAATNLVFRAWRYQPHDLFLQTQLTKTARLAGREDLIEDLKAWEAQSPLFVPQLAELLGLPAGKSGFLKRLPKGQASRRRAHRELRKSFNLLYRRLNGLIVRRQR